MYNDEIGKSISVLLKNIAYLRFDQGSCYPSINSPFARMYFITEGEGQLSIGGETIKLEPGYLYLIPSFTTCTYQFNKGLAHTYIHFNLGADNGINIFTIYSVFNKVLANETDTLLFKRLLEINPEKELPHDDPNVYQAKPWVNKKTEFKSLAQQLETTGIIQQLFSHFLRNESEKNMSSFLTYKIQPVLAHIHDNLPNDTTIKSLAAMACLSKDHFTRVFKSIIGMPPCEFIIRKRIEKAQFLLLTTNMTQSRIIEETGFKTVSYFCRIFKRYTGYTPVEYRKQPVHSV